MILIGNASRNRRRGIVTGMMRRLMVRIVGITLRGYRRNHLGGRNWWIGIRFRGTRWVAIAVG